MATAISFSISDWTNALSLGSFSNSGRSMFRLTYLVIDPDELLGAVFVVDDDEFCFLTTLLYDGAVDDTVLLVRVALFFNDPAVGGAGGRSNGADVAWGNW